MFLKRLSQNFKKIGLKHWVTTSRQLEGPIRKSETLTTPNAGERVEHRELSFTAGGDAQMVRPLGKTIWQFLKKINSLLLPQI